LLRITGLRLTGCAESTPGNTINVREARQLRRKIVIICAICAVFPEPARRTKFGPTPPQSSTSSRTPDSTVTNCSRCGDESCHGAVLRVHAKINSSPSGTLISAILISNFVRLPCTNIRQDCIPVVNCREQAISLKTAAIDRTATQTAYFTSYTALPPTTVCKT
jgi:hypothetical protein